MDLFKKIHLKFKSTEKCIIKVWEIYQNKEQEAQYSSVNLKDDFKARIIAELKRDTSTR